MNQKKCITGLIVLVIILVGVIVYLAIGKKAENAPSASNVVPQGKLNVDLVCKGALTYMTFKNSADADKFVAECKEGKHPKVFEIENLKAQLILGEDVKM